MILAFVDPCWAATRLPAIESISLLTNANGGDAVRVPIVSTPVWLIFSRVDCCASAGAATDSASPRVERTVSTRLIVTLRLVGEDFRQELPGTLRPGGGEELLGR